ncbi:hypothetical protein VTK56DRAFT_7023 [Thermocarpiscus australiensis]
METDLAIASPIHFCSEDKESGGNHGNQAACPLPDCVKEAEYREFFGKEKQWRLTDSMMKSYVAMRRGVNGLPGDPEEPMLAHLLGQESNTTGTNLHMAHNILRSMNSGLPDDPNRPQVYYYDPFVDAKHIAVPPGYDIDEISAENARRSEGWERANRPDSKEDEPQSAGTHQSTYVEAPGTPRSTEEESTRTTYARFMMQPIQAPPTPPPYKEHKRLVDDGWVSDTEGHPERSRITPCTFALWATGCRPADQKKDDAKRAKPDAPAEQQAGSKMANDDGPSSHTGQLKGENKAKANADPIELDEISTALAVELLRDAKATISRLKKEKEKLKAERAALLQKIDQLETKILFDKILADTDSVLLPKVSRTRRTLVAIRQRVHDLRTRAGAAFYQHCVDTGRGGLAADLFLRVLMPAEESWRLTTSW